MREILSFVCSVVASVVAYYICKWLWPECDEEAMKDDEVQCRSRMVKLCLPSMVISGLQ